LIKIALTGSHGVGKSTMANRVARRAHDDGWAVEVVSSPTRYLKNLGKRYGLANNKDSDGQLELMNLITMRLRGWEAEAKLRPYEDGRINNRRPTLVIGDRCTLDMVAYMQDLINRADWSVDDKDAVVARQRLVDACQLGLPFALHDVAQFWDVLCYKPPHPDYLTADPDRLDDREYQLAIDRCMKANWDRARHLYGLSTRELDIDLYKASDQVWRLVRDIHRTGKVDK
jgi:hypothetical protein